ncbi:MAG: hypothetical protein L0207_06610 [Chlamydiae bacterium]|nr:hypothetical protein [Chlamydiota bacterium]
MMNRLKLTILFIVFFASCSKDPGDTLVSQMQLRTLQTRTYVGQDLKSVIKGIIHVLQDDGYIVKNINLDLGILTAERDFDIEKFSSVFFAYLFSGSNARWKKHTIIEMTSNVSDVQNQITVRTNFQVKIFENTGRVLEVYPVRDEKFYQTFFDKVQASLISSTNFRPANN